MMRWMTMKWKKFSNEQHISNMIYDKYAKHLFLSPKWCKILIDNGISMDDASFFLYKDFKNTWHVYTKNEYKDYVGDEDKVIPTYSLADIMFKLDEYPCVNDIGCPLEYIKDAPFYIFAYYFNKSKGIKKDTTLPVFSNGKNYVEAFDETPLLAAARMLLVCKNNNISFGEHAYMKYDECDYPTD